MFCVFTWQQGCELRASNGTQQSNGTIYEKSSPFNANAIMAALLRHIPERGQCRNPLGTYGWSYYTTAVEVVQALECNETAWMTTVAPALNSVHGPFPCVNDFVIGPLATPMIIIAPVDAKDITQGYNIYLTTFQPQVWVVTAAILLLFAGCHAKHQSLNGLYGPLAQIWVKSVLTFAGPFLGQCNFSERHLTAHVRFTVGSFLVFSLLLNTLYQCALNSDFVMRETVQLNISSIEDLVGYRVYLIFDDTYSPSLNTYCKWNKDLRTQYLCMEIKQQLDQCGLADQIMLLRDSPWKIPHKKGLSAVFEKLELITMSEMAENLLNHSKADGRKFAILTSQLDFSLTWSMLLQSTKTVNYKFSYKMDSRKSSLLPIVGVQFPLRLRANEVWIRQKVRAVMESGVALQWSQLKTRDSTLRNLKLTEKWKSMESAPAPISASNSWLSVVFLSRFCEMTLAICLVVWTGELLVYNFCNQDAQ